MSKSDLLILSIFCIIFILLAAYVGRVHSDNEKDAAYQQGYNDAMEHVAVSVVHGSLRDCTLLWGDTSALSVLVKGADFSECEIDTTNHNQLRYHIFDSIDVDGDISGLKEVEYTQK